MQMQVTLSKILIFVAVFLFILSALGFYNLVAAGLAFWAGSQLL